MKFLLVIWRAAGSQNPEEKSYRCVNDKLRYQEVAIVPDESTIIVSLCKCFLMSAPGLIVDYDKLWCEHMIIN